MEKADLFEEIEVYVESDIELADVSTDAYYTELM